MRATVQCVYITLGLVFITLLNFRPRLVSVYSPHFGSAEAPAIYAFNENPSPSVYKALPAASSARCCCCCCRCCRYALRAFPEFPFPPRCSIYYIIIMYVRRRGAMDSPPAFPPPRRFLYCVQALLLAASLFFRANIYAVRLYRYDVYKHGHTTVVRLPTRKTSNISETQCSVHDSKLYILYYIPLDLHGYITRRVPTLSPVFIASEP